MDENQNPDFPGGYKKPPRHTQFKPGQSGNAKGRPKRSTAPADVVRKQVRKIASVTVGGKVQKMSMLEIIAMKQISQAASGDHKSALLVFGALKANESDQNNNLPELLQQFRTLHAGHVATGRAPFRSSDGDQDGQKKEE
jgi:hypothetical protein